MKQGWIILQARAPQNIIIDNEKTAILVYLKSLQ